jgi:hypothetical protein
MINVPKKLYSGNFKMRDHLERLDNWEDSIKKDFKEIGPQGDWILSAQFRDHWSDSCAHSNELFLSHKRRETS